MGLTPTPGLYHGTLHHRRTAPRVHAFSYPLFMVLLDVDRIPELMSASWLTAYNRWNWASFHDRDHVGDPRLPLRERLALDAARHGIAMPDGPVYLLTHLRYLGYCFNPVSFYYCFDSRGGLATVMAEVRNTFGGSHNYWLEPRRATSPERTPARFLSSTDKSFYVSPFMPADMAYSFAFTEPADQLVVRMTVADASQRDEPHAFDATLRLTHRPWTPLEIRRALLRYPIMTASVIAGIHWQAVRLWAKGMKVQPRPTPNGAYPDHHGVQDAGRA